MATTTAVPRAASRPGPIVWLGLAVVLAAAAVLSFDALRGLALAVGIPGRFAWLLPVAVDAGAAVSCAVWLGRRATPDASAFAGRMTWALLVVTVLGNAAQLGMHAHHIAPPWWVAVLVGAIPPAVVGATVHLVVLLVRATTRVEQISPEEAEEISAEIGVPVAVPRVGRCYVYRLLSVHDDLLYVGITEVIRTRLAEHRREKPWWSEVARADIEAYTTRAEALSVEHRAIHREKPKYNAHPGSPIDGLSRTALPLADQVGPVHAETIELDRTTGKAAAPSPNVGATTRTDADLLSALRVYADRTGKRPGRNAVAAELGIGATRAARLLEEFDRTGPRRTA